MRELTPSDVLSIACLLSFFIGYLTCLLLYIYSRYELKRKGKRHD